MSSKWTEASILQGSCNSPDSKGGCPGLENGLVGVESVEINNEPPNEKKQRFSTQSKQVSHHRLHLAETRRQVGGGSHTVNKEEDFRWAQTGGWSPGELEADRQ